MNTHRQNAYLSKAKVHHDTKHTQRVPHETCSNLRNGENYVLWRHIHGSAENVARAVWMNDASQTKIRLKKVVPKKNSFCMEINIV